MLSPCSAPQLSQLLELQHLIPDQGVLPRIAIHFLSFSHKHSVPNILVQSLQHTYSFKCNDFAVVSTVKAFLKFMGSLSSILLAEVFPLFVALLVLAGWVFLSRYAF